MSNKERRKQGNLRQKTSRYSTDEKFALFAYLLIILYTCSGIFFDDVTAHMQHRFTLVYSSLLILLLGFVVILAVCIIFKRLKLELIMLCLFTVGTIVLFGEKSLFYILDIQSTSLGHYFTYISLNIAEVPFAIYRLLKVKELLEFRSESAQYFKEYDERNSTTDRGDDNVG